MRKLQPQELGGQPGRLIDVRGIDEFSAERLPNAECIPLDHLVSRVVGWDRSEPLIVMCKSGVRSDDAARQLEGLGFSSISVVAGGIDACRKAGLNVVLERRRIPIIRQVMIVVGAILLLALGLAFVYPGFMIVNWLMGLGLLMAGLTGHCPMAKALAYMPWNRSTAGCKTGSCA